MEGGFRFRLYRVPAVVSPVEMIAWKAGPLSLAARHRRAFPRSGGFQPKACSKAANLFAPFSHLSLSFQNLGDHPVTLRD